MFYGHNRSDVFQSLWELCRRQQLLTETLHFPIAFSVAVHANIARRGTGPWMYCPIIYSSLENKSGLTVGEETLVSISDMFPKRGDAASSFNSGDTWRSN